MPTRHTLRATRDVAFVRSLACTVYAALVYVVATLSCTLAVSSASYADLVFTAVGIMSGTDFGYTYHQPATFTFTLTENTIFGSGANGYYEWIQQPSDPNLYASVTGTSLTVTTPSLPGSTANGGSSFGTPYFQVSAQVNAVGPDGVTPIDNVTLTISSTAFNLGPVTNPAPTPYDYLKTLAGNYNSGQFDTDSCTLSGPGGAFNSLTYTQFLSVINVPVPEPSTWLMGAGVLPYFALGRWRRRGG